MKQSSFFLAIFVLVTTLMAPLAFAQQNPPPPKLNVPDYRTVKAPVKCINCDLPFDPIIHNKLLKRLAANPYVAQLRKALYVQDIWHQFQSKAHFDNCDFNASMNYIDALLAEVDGLVKIAKTAHSSGKGGIYKFAIEQAFFTLGQAMHAVQDFYAHSNYVELKITKAKRVIDIEVLRLWKKNGRKKINDLQAKGLISGYVFWGLPQNCPDGTLSHRDLAKDNADTKKGKIRIPHLRNISHFKVAEFLARESSVALMKHAFKRWPTLENANGKLIAFETFVDRRKF